VSIPLFAEGIDRSIPVAESGVEPQIRDRGVDPGDRIEVDSMACETRRSDRRIDRRSRSPPGSGVDDRIDPVDPMAGIDPPMQQNTRIDGRFWRLPKPWRLHHPGDQRTAWNTAVQKGWIIEVEEEA
jgi:hypothetical protein